MLAAQAAVVVANSSGTPGFLAFQVRPPADNVMSLAAKPSGAAGAADTILMPPGCCEQKALFGAQQSFWNENSAHLSLTQTIAQLKPYAKAVAPQLSDVEWAAQMAPVPGTGGSASDMASREAWKYGAYRCVSSPVEIFAAELKAVN